MPRRNETGPEGAGPMTGRRAGYCTGDVGTGWKNPSPGRLGGAFRKGTGFHGFLRGYRTAPTPPINIARIALQSECDVLRDQLETAEKELATLDAEDKK